MTALAQEIELKLELTESAAETLIGSDILPPDPLIKNQKSIYFDTSEHDLLAAGFSLRVRETADVRIQTTKAFSKSAAGLFARPEWERTLETSIPILDDTTPIRALLREKADRISAAFEVHIERRVWNLKRVDAAIELVMDRGEVLAGDRRSPIFEVELELKLGSPAALFDLAREIDTFVPLRLSVLSKAERGYRLLGAAARSIKAEPVALTRDMTAAAAFRQISSACIRHFRLNEMLLDNRDPEALHQCRVALRRLRSAFSIHKKMLQDESFDGFREDLRWLAGELGDARSIDVLMSHCDMSEIRAQLEPARHEAYVRAEEALSTVRARGLMLDLSQWLEVGDWMVDPARRELRDKPVKEFGAAALDLYRKHVKKRGRQLAKLDDAARHEVRKDAKRLRYASEFYGSLFGEKRQRRRYKRFVRALESLQANLGALNDLATTPELLLRLGIDGASWLGEQEKKTFLGAAVDAHEELLDAKRFWS